MRERHNKRKKLGWGGGEEDGKERKKKRKGKEKGKEQNCRMISPKNTDAKILNKGFGN